MGETKNIIEIDCIDHIVLRTTQIEVMIEFYCSVLGCTIERTLPEDVGLVQLRAGTSLVDLVRVDSLLGRKGGHAPQKTGHNLDHFCLRLKSISNEDLSAYLISKNIDGVEFVTRYGAEGDGYSAYINDPDGNMVELRSALQRVLAK